MYVFYAKELHNRNKSYEALDPRGHFIMDMLYVISGLTGCMRHSLILDV